LKSIIYCNIFVNIIIAFIVKSKIFVKLTIKISITSCFFFEQNVLKIEIKDINIMFNSIEVFEVALINIKIVSNLKLNTFHKYIDLNNLLLIKTKLIIKFLIMLLINIVINFEFIVVCFALIKKLNKKIAINLDI